MLTISLLFTVYYIFKRGISLIVKYAYQQIVDWSYRKTKAITAPISNFVFVLLHLFEGTDRICETIETI